MSRRFPLYSALLTVAISAAVIAGVYLWPVDVTDPIEDRALGSSDDVASYSEKSTSQERVQSPPRVPSDWDWVRRTYPHYAANPSAIRQALEERKLMVAAGKTGQAQWSFLGPSNIGGRIVDIEFNPKDPNKVYLGAATGGVFKSEDAGNTWTSVFDDQAVLTIGDIGIDPNHPDTLYVGTGEANGGHNNFAGAGVYKSIDGGLTWSYTGLEEVVSIGRVVVDPANSDRVFVAALGSYFATHPDRGVYRSENGGATWQHVLSISDSTGVVDLAINPRNPDTLFAASWERVRRPNGGTYLHGAGSAVRRSTDGGTTWQLLGPEKGLPDPSAFKDETGRPRFGRIGLAINESDPSYVYALYTHQQPNFGWTFFGVYRSRDGGDSWHEMPTSSAVQNAFSNFSWYFGQIRVSPNDTDQVYLLDVSMALTDDGGDTWKTVPGTHADHHALAFHPEDDQVILGGNDGGLARSTNGGATWSRIDGLPITQFYEVSVDPTNPDNVLGGTQDNGSIRSFGSQTNSWFRISGGDGFYTIVDPDNPQTVYSTSQNGQLYRNGATLVGSNTYKSNWSTPVVMHPTSSSTLYYGADRLLRSEDRGDTWVYVSPNLSSHGASDRLGTITTISVAQSDPDVLYVGTDDGNVWVTVDNADTWTNVSGGLPLRWVTRVEAHPSDPGTAVVTYSGLKWRDSEAHVFQTFDFGQSWQDISGNLPDAPINALALDPLNQDQIFVGTDVGAFYSNDGGTLWQVLGTGLPATPVYDLKIVPNGRTIVAGTHGRSMFSIPIPESSTSVEPVHNPGSVALTATAYPNPSAGPITISFRHPDATATGAAVFDALGRRIRDLSISSSLDSETSTIWDGRNDSGGPAGSGVYFVRIELKRIGTAETVISALPIIRSN